MILAVMWCVNSNSDCTFIIFKGRLFVIQIEKCYNDFQAAADKDRAEDVLKAVAGNLADSTVMYCLSGTGCCVFQMTGKHTLGG